jgi:hypothetical protein
MSITNSIKKSGILPGNTKDCYENNTIFLPGNDVVIWFNNSAASPIGNRAGNNNTEGSPYVSRSTLDVYKSRKAGTLKDFSVHLGTAVRPAQASSSTYHYARLDTRKKP